MKPIYYIIRGCSWYYNPHYAHRSSHFSASPEEKFDSLGIRVVVRGQ
jgi:formylglycine-generating enzyme required for sulfatase activity